MDILVVGGGASGMMAAISAAKLGANVTVFEKNDRVGKKILSTGNGKCNLTNLNMDLSMYNTDDRDKLRYCLNAFGEKDTLDIFGQFGLMLKNKNGYIYPLSEQASVVLDVLRHMLDVLGVNIKTGMDVKEIYAGNGFDVITDGSKYHFDKVILACGSYAGFDDKKKKNVNSYELAKKLGHSIIPVLPALVQVVCTEEYYKSIAGVRCDATVTLYNENGALRRERGELQITDYGLSGIVMFQLSSEISRRLEKHEKLNLVIDLLPEFDEDPFESFISGRIKSYLGENVESFFLGMIHKKLSALIMRSCHLKPTDIVDETNAADLYKACFMMKAFTAQVRSTKGFENAQVCTGGVPLAEVNEKLESVYHKGLYLCGEILNVDGKCGGYNLQWAWTSGCMAGSFAAADGK